MPFLDLIIENIHGSRDDFVYLLSYGADRDNGFSGNRRIIKSDNFVVIWKFTVFLNQLVQQNIGKSIIRQKDSLGQTGVFLVYFFEKIFQNPGCLFIAGTSIGKNQFVADLVLFTNISKTFDTTIRRHLTVHICIDVDEDICSGFGKKAGSLYCSHIVVGVDTVYILIFTFDGDDRYIIRCKFPGRDGMTENDHSFYFVGE